MRRYAARRDANEAAIVSALRSAGCSVLRLDAVDLLVGQAGRNYLFEVKDGNKPPSARKLTPLQESILAGWRGQYAVVTSPADALDKLSKLARQGWKL